MFLQEILKYPSLELAVGLELDQKVVRGAFKYFGTQPHWDNEKVQWWFGDASKSLLMLPEDYFGSFDVVLVDLSDTLLSLSVTKEMDIIGALSLLLRPDGVFAMNELVCFVLLLAGMNIE
jgi:spermidine synthase